MISIKTTNNFGYAASGLYNPLMLPIDKPAFPHMGFLYHYLSSRPKTFLDQSKWPILITVALALPFSNNVLATTPSHEASSDRIQIDDDNRDHWGTLSIESTAQIRSGLKTLTLEPHRYRPELIAYGNVVSLQPLLDLRNRYLAALSGHESAKSRLTLAQQSIDRTRLLHRGGVVSGRSLQEQQSQWQSQQALTKGSRIQIETVRNEAILNWGRPIAELFLDTNTDTLLPYLSGQKNLLHISLPPNNKPVDTLDEIRVSRYGDRNRAEPARFISPAPQTDPMTQGESYFFETEHGGIRTGMRVAAFIPLRENAEVGVLIPASSVIRHLGQIFVYVKTAPEHFQRRNIAGLIDAHAGYFVTDGLHAGQEIVVKGAQILLSEEFKSQIPDDEDDDD